MNAVPTKSCEYFLARLWIKTGARFYPFLWITPPVHDSLSTVYNFIKRPVFNEFHGFQQIHKPYYYD